MLDECMNLLKQRETVLEQNIGRRSRISELNAFGVMALAYLRMGNNNQALAIAEQAVDVIMFKGIPSVFLYPGYAAVMDVLFGVLVVSDDDANTEGIFRDGDAQVMNSCSLLSLSLWSMSLILFSSLSRWSLSH